jgi:hypothetical protein
MGTTKKNKGAVLSTKNGKTKQMREEISLELAELGNVTPNHEPMTPNIREKSEAEKYYP